MKHVLTDLAGEVTIAREGEENENLISVGQKKAKRTLV